MNGKQRRSAPGILLLILAAAAGTALAIYAWFNSQAIGHTAGVLVVMSSSALMWLAALLLATIRLPVWLRVILLFLLLIDVLGTGIAAWFLETQVLMAFMGLALLGWLAHVLAGPRLPRPEPAHAETAP